MGSLSNNIQQTFVECINYRGEQVRGPVQGSRLSEPRPSWHLRVAPCHLGVSLPSWGSTYHLRGTPSLWGRGRAVMRIVQGLRASLAPPPLQASGPVARCDNQVCLQAFQSSPKRLSCPSGESKVQWGVRQVNSWFLDAGFRMVPRAGGEARGDRPILQGGWTVEEAGREAGDAFMEPKRGPQMGQWGPMEGGWGQASRWAAGSWGARGEEQAGKGECLYGGAGRRHVWIFFESLSCSLWTHLSTCMHTHMLTRLQM